MLLDQRKTTEETLVMKFDILSSRMQAISEIINANVSFLQLT